MATVFGFSAAARSFPIGQPRSARDRSAVRASGGATDLEMQSSSRRAQAASGGSTLAPPGSQDDEPSQLGHGREASGRSVMSNISQRLRNMRENDRAATDNALQNNEDIRMATQEAMTAQANATADGRAATDLEAQAAQNGAPSRNAAYLAGLRSSKKGPNRREREEAACLFGPNLATYFPSNATFSAVSPSAAAQPAAVEPAQPGASAVVAPPGSQSLAASLGRKARLGSRGRARGASLSGVASQLSLPIGASESVASLPQGQDPVASPSHPLDGSAPQHADITSTTEALNAVALADGIELDTLQRWIHRSVDGQAPLHSPNLDISAVPDASGAPPAVCSTLQSYVNLKRNTVKLVSEPGQPAVIAASPMVNGDTTAPSSPLEPTSPGGFSASETGASGLRVAPSFSSITALGAGGPRSGLGLPASPLVAQHGRTASSAAPPTTHKLSFEYDCAAPFASVQVFLRASRKHGSWNSDFAADRSVSNAISDNFYAQRGPPPHVLGWPVHSAQVKKGFGDPLSIALALQLAYYAPASGRKRAGDVSEGVGGDVNATNDLPLETPALNASRQLESAPAPVPGPAPLPVIPDQPVPETKEARAAREKSERETLKLAVVVEALDEDGRPLSEPNLQTTYMRVTSLPVKPPAGDGAEPALFAPRAWSIQVEGQEAEIGAHRFQLQELYGLSRRPPPVRPAPPEAGEGEDGEATAGSVPPPPPMDLDGSNGSECIICLSAPPTTLLLPCTHSLCLECAVQLRESVKAMRETERRRGRTPRRKYNCPACRRAFTSMLHLSSADEKQIAHANV
ncbi:hypothetical protein PSEUBRA_SCAF9g01292 [Ceraceosorus bombacis]|uniref:RING-type domain-containing protein n=1 Tax=Ceraceosorus bombacis TaxID=401625 RepID=A0A0P1BEL8_9BASI|nr:hypothetical protein PSEUBRA_SCAF9g01292 [Ceraceosorus bombacis]